MRRIGPLVLVIIFVLAGVVASSWLTRVRHQQRSTPAVPRMLPPNISSTAQDWVYRHSDANGTRVEVRAKDYRLVDEPDKLELKGMELRPFQADWRYLRQGQFGAGRIRHARWRSLLRGRGVHRAGCAGGTRAGRQVSGDSSPPAFTSRTRRARRSPTAPASFRFSMGQGTCVGASYDPQTHELILQSQVELVVARQSTGHCPDED